MTALIPLEKVDRMASAMAKSGLFGFKTTEQALALMLVAQAEGAHPATIAQDYDIIQGRAARKTHSVLARFQQAGGKVTWHELSDEAAEATFSHPQGEARIRWTIDQARRIGLVGKDNWKNYPRAMLRSRCIAEGIRAAYPAAIGGMLVTEEAQDMPRERYMGATVVVEEVQVDADAIVAEVATITDAAALQAKWQGWSAECQKAHDIESHKTIKAAVAARLEAIRNNMTVEVVQQ